MIIVWLPRAIKNRDSQIDYIAQNNPRAAMAQGDRIQEQIDQLIEHPGMGRPGRIKNTRELVISGTPFVVVYRYQRRAKRIEVIRLLHGSQQWPTARKSAGIHSVSKTADDQQSACEQDLQS